VIYSQLKKPNSLFGTDDYSAGVKNAPVCQLRVAPEVCQLRI